MHRRRAGSAKPIGITEKTLEYRLNGMSNSQSKNRKLSAWIGSILFHVALFLLALVWFSFVPNTKSASGDGERTAAGTIVLQSRADARQQSASAEDDPQNADSDIAEIVSEQFASVALDILPQTPALAPGQGVLYAPGTESAADLAALLQQGTSNNPGSGIGTGETTLQIFGTSGKGTKFVYVFDRSASMDGRPIQRAKAELIRSLDSLGEFHQFNIIFYSGTWQLWRSGRGRMLVFATPPEKDDARRFVESITAVGGTRHFEPLMEAVAHRPDVIFFLTDGESKDDLRADQLREIERLNSRAGRGAQINVIQFGSGGLTDSPSRSLQQLATDNHGQYDYVNVDLLRLNGFEDRLVREPQRELTYFTQKRRLW